MTAQSPQVDSKEWTNNDYADFWYYTVGVNVIPYNGVQKSTRVKWKHHDKGNFQTDSIPIEIFDAWKKAGSFSNGIAIICGKVFRGEHKGEWLNGLDFDNIIAITELFPTETVKQYSTFNLIEQHDNVEKCHTYFYTKNRPLTSKIANDDRNEGDDSPTKPQIEIKSNGSAIMNCTPSPHKDGSKLRILGTRHIITVNADAFENSIDSICKKYNIPYLKNIDYHLDLPPVQSLIDSKRKMYAGEDRQLPLLRYLASKKIKNPELSIESLRVLAFEFQNEHFADHYPDDIINQKVKSAMNFGTEKINEHLEEENKSGGILGFVEPLYRRLHELDYPDEFYIYNAFWFVKNHTAPGYTDEIIQKIAGQSVTYIKNKIKQEENEKYKKMILGVIDEEIITDCLWIATFMVKNLKIINKAEIHANITEWFVQVQRIEKLQEKSDKNYTSKADEFPIKDVIKMTFNNKVVLESLKNLAREYGRLKEKITLSNDQHVEASAYLIERFHVKRHGLDGKLLYYNDVHYDYTATEFLFREAIDMMVRAKNTDLKEVFYNIKNKAPTITLQEIMQHAHIICLKNGLYNIKTRKFSSKFSPEYYVFDQTPYNYDSTVPFGTIQKFVNDMIPNENDRQFFYDFSSICFHPYNGIYFQLGLVGPPGTGKTQLVILTKYCFDEDMVHDATIQMISDDATVRQDTAMGRINAEGDMHDVGIKTISNLKRFISQEGFTDRAIYDHSKKYRPSSRVMFSANSLYEIPNEQDALAIYDRTKLIKFEEKIRHTGKDKKDFVENHIPKEEFGGYVTFLLNNASDIWERQNTKYTLNPAEARDIWNEVGNYIRQFVDKYIVKDSHSTVKALDIKDKCEEYFENHDDIDKSFKPGEFYKILDEVTRKEREKVKLHGTNDSVLGYHGLRLKTDGEIEHEEQQRLSGLKDNEK